MRPKPAMRQTMQKLDLNIESLSELTIFKSESHVHYVKSQTNAAVVNNNLKMLLQILRA